MVASTAFIASANSAAFSVPTGEQLMIGVDITAASGTPVLDLWLQASDDGGTTWYDLPHDIAMQSSSTATENAPTTLVRSIIDNRTSTSAAQFVAIYKSLPSDRIRLKWIISGTTPSFTFSASMVTK